MRKAKVKVVRRDMINRKEKVLHIILGIGKIDTIPEVPGNEVLHIITMEISTIPIGLFLPGLDNAHFFFVVQDLIEI
jgi:hypothetical protein